MLRLHPGTIDYVILGIYFVVVLGIGFVARLSIKTDLDFFLSGRSLPAWITGLAFIAANLGALEILGQAANGAQYGVAAVHYYWIGAVPAMVFLGLFMMPFYYGAKVRSVPEYLRLRFNEAAHAFNAVTFAVATVLISGVNLFALALIIHLLLGWSVTTAILVAAAMVLIYITLGGLTSAIYNEVLQFFVIVAALLPLTLVALHAIGGISGIERKVKAFKPLGNPGLHAWQGLGIHHVTNPLASDWVGVVFGLGFVLSFGYWTTNFAEVQRALSAKNLSASRRTPLIGAYPKIFLPAIIVLPGIIAVLTVKGLGGSSLSLQYNTAIPHLIGNYLPEGMLGVAVTGLLAAFMAGVAANVTSFNTVVTYDLIQAYFVKDRDPAYYLRRGPDGDDRRSSDLGAHGVHRQGLLEHHELHPDAVLDLQRAAVRDLHHRHVLEAGVRLGRVLQPRGGYGGGVCDKPPGRLRGDLPLRLGAQRQLLAGDHRVYHRRGGARRGVAGDQAQADEGAGRPGLGHGQQGRRGGRRSARQALVALAVAARRRGDRNPRRSQHNLRVGAQLDEYSANTAQERSSMSTAETPHRSAAR